MPAMLPVMLVSAHLVLVAQHVPQLDVTSGCRVAASAAVGARHSMDACLRDEQRARATLQDQWGAFGETERARCLRLTRLGGPPSYVELLTCLQMDKAAERAPGAGARGGRVGR